MRSEQAWLMNQPESGRWCDSIRCQGCGAVVARIDRAVCHLGHGVEWNDLCIKCAKAWADAEAFGATCP